MLFFSSRYLFAFDLNRKTKKGSIYWRYQPESQTVKINDSLILKCEGESSEALQYQWYNYCLLKNE